MYILRLSPFTSAKRPLLYGSVAGCQVCAPAMITALQPHHTISVHSQASLLGFPRYQSIQFSAESCQINPIYRIALQNLFLCQEITPSLHMCVWENVCPQKQHLAPLESIALLLPASFLPETAARF